MSRPAAFLCGVLAYLVFFLTFLYAIGFVGNLLVPRSIDVPAGAFSGAALLVDFVLLGVFALQHSLMARPGLKRAWTRIVAEPIERSLRAVRKPRADPALLAVAADDASGLGGARAWAARSCSVSSGSAG